MNQLRCTPKQPYLFFREDGFYCLLMDNDLDAIKNAERNPGTIKVSDATNSRIVWKAPMPIKEERVSSRDGVTCDKCGGYVPGHATGAGDICTCEPIVTAGKGMSELDWPTEPGIWMGWIEGVGWFPMIAKLLKEYPPDEPHIPMPIVCQFPESATSWPFTFQGCHPAKRWRRPTDEELVRANHFYGLTGTAT